jgi:F-type H+-transporting ATPase subunit delta
VSEAAIARAYATALFDAASAASTVERTGADLRGFVQALADSPELAGVVFNPQIEPDAKMRVVSEIMSRADRLAVGVLRVMLVKRRLALVAEVADQYDRFVAEAEHVVAVQVTTAVPVGADVEHLIADGVRHSTGGEPRLNMLVDPDILGGLVLRVDDLQVDGSLRSRLQQLDSRLRTADVRGGNT